MSKLNWECEAALIIRLDTCSMAISITECLNLCYANSNLDQKHFKIFDHRLKQFKAGDSDTWRDDYGGNPFWNTHF